MVRRPQPFIYAMTLSYNEIEDFIRTELASLTFVDKSSVTRDTVLVGQNRILDSADLVILLLAVEDFAKEKLNVEWDWTSDSAMSEARSVLRNVGSLAKHLSELQPA
ncbi:MAG: acyl carrier protein [Gemmatimonadaceae bacterium]